MTVFPFPCKVWMKKSSVKEYSFWGETRPVLYVMLSKNAQRGSKIKSLSKGSVVGQGEVVATTPRKPFQLQWEQSTETR